MQRIPNFSLPFANRIAAGVGIERRMLLTVDQISGSFLRLLMKQEQLFQNYRRRAAGVGGHFSQWSS